MSARAVKGFTQKELAKASGINQSDISKIEKGIANPTVTTLKRIASALGMKLQVSLVQE